MALIKHRVMLPGHLQIGVVSVDEPTMRVFRRICSYIEVIGEDMVSVGHADCLQDSCPLCQPVEFDPCV